MFSLLPPINVHVINLDRDTDRLGETMERFAGLPNFKPQRHAAFLGSTLPDSAVRALVGSNTHLRGALGCFLAHVGAWEKVAEGDAMALIVEDDVDPTDLDRLLLVEMPDDADIVWCNHRMDPARTVEREGRKLWQEIPKAVPVKVMLAPKVLKKGPPGGDGYLLSPAGARKILAAVDEDGFSGHVDWRMLRYCLESLPTQDMIKGSWMEDGPLDSAIDHAWGVVKGYCLDPSVIRHRGEIISSRRGLDGKIT
jgi:GR25 family glycosyltransferase involved in LPS biosynthesis